MFRFALRINTPMTNAMVIDIPPRFGNLESYKTTLGHKGLFEFFTFLHDSEHVLILIFESEKKCQK